MAETRPPETSKDLVEAFASLFNEVEPETPEEIDAVLRDAGHDLHEVAARMKAIAEKAIADSPLNWRERAKKDLPVALVRLKQFSLTATHDRTTIAGAIHELIAQLGAEVQPAFAHFRNLDSVSDEDLASLLADLEYLSSQQSSPEEGRK
jgi:hypothetical protein